MVCQEWEKAAHAIDARGSRVVHPRFGTVLGKGGGALQKMLLPYRLGLGGRIGTGKQWMSWIALEDLLRVFHQILQEDHWVGPINVVSPQPVRQVEFSKRLAHHLHRPAPIPEPGWLLRLLFKEMADEVLLASARVIPTKLEKARFSFSCPNLDKALENALN